MMAIGFTALTQVVAPGDAGKSITKALSGFGDKVIWLIGISFFIARGFIKTGLGTVLLFYLSEFLEKFMGLAYGLGLADVSGSGYSK
jgi:DASS family divalent anion:Na+ symporter